MARTLVAILKEIVDNTDDVRFSGNYSGRGMYGKTCISISGSEGDCRGVLVEAVKEMMSDLAFAGTGNSEDLLPEYQGIVEELMLEYSTDSLGRGIVMYWSQIADEPEVDPEIQDFENNHGQGG